MTTTPDEIADAVRSTCVLVTVRLRAFGTTRTDNEASREVTRDKGAKPGAGRVTANRLTGADELHKQIVQAQTQAREDVKAYTMPYGNDEGWRLLPNKNF